MKIGGGAIAALRVTYPNVVCPPPFFVLQRKFGPALNHLNMAAAIVPGNCLVRLNRGVALASLGACLSLPPVLIEPVLGLHRSTGCPYVLCPLVISGAGASVVGFLFSAMNRTSTNEWVSCAMQVKKSVC